MLPDSLTQSLTAVASIVRFSPNAQQLEALLSKIPLSLSDIAPEERFHCLLAATVILHQTGMGAQNLKVESVVSKMKDGGEVDRLLGWSLKLAQKVPSLEVKRRVEHLIDMHQVFGRYVRAMTAMHSLAPIEDFECVLRNVWVLFCWYNLKDLQNDYVRLRTNLLQSLLLTLFSNRRAHLEQLAGSLFQQETISHPFIGNILSRERKLLTLPNVRKIGKHLAASYQQIKLERKLDIPDELCFSYGGYDGPNEPMQPHPSFQQSPIRIPIPSNRAALTRASTHCPIGVEGDPSEESWINFCSMYGNSVMRPYLTCLLQKFQVTTLSQLETNIKRFYTSVVGGYCRNLVCPNSTVDIMFDLFLYQIGVFLNGESLQNVEEILSSRFFFTVLSCLCGYLFLDSYNSFKGSFSTFCHHFGFSYIETMKILHIFALKDKTMPPSILSRLQFLEKTILVRQIWSDSIGCQIIELSSVSKNDELLSILVPRLIKHVYFRLLEFQTVMALQEEELEEVKDVLNWVIRERRVLRGNYLDVVIVCCVRNVLQRMRGARSESLDQLFNRHLKLKLSSVSRITSIVDPGTGSPIGLEQFYEQNFNYPTNEIHSNSPPSSNFLDHSVREASLLFKPHTPSSSPQIPYFEKEVLSHETASEPPLL